MADNQTVSAEASAMLKLMMDVSEHLPANWDVGGQWLAGAQDLAQIVADHRQTIGRYETGALVQAGAIMLVMANRERQSQSITACMIDRLRDRGVHD